MEELIDLYTEFWSRPENVERLMKLNPNGTFQADGTQLCIHCKKLEIQHDHFNQCLPN